MAKRTREQRHADNVAAETQRRINQGDSSSYVQGQIRDNPGQFKNTVESYRAGLSPSGATKQEPREITLADGNKMMTYGSFEPGQFAGNQYDGILSRLKSDKKNLGLSSLTQAGPSQNFGYGSPFGTSSGSTASSSAVQNSIRAMTEDLYNQGYSEPVAAQIAMDKMYPGYIDYSSGKINPKTGQPYDIPVNFMDMNKGNKLPGHTMIMDEYTPGSLGGGYGGGDGGGPGGWGDSWGAGGDYSGGGGGGGGYGYAEEDFTPRGNPNEAWGQQNPLQQAMISIHGGQGFQQGFARGGIVSLVA